MKELAKDSYDLYLLEREILIMKDLSHPGLIAMEAVSFVFFSKSFFDLKNEK